jgi:hypothetical protein
MDSPLGFLGLERLKNYPTKDNHPPAISYQPKPGDGFLKGLFNSNAPGYKLVVFPLLIINSS